MSGGTTSPAHRGTQHWPTEIRYDKASRVLHLAFEDGRSFELPAEMLRVESPSAEVMGHGPSQKQIVAGRRHVGITAIEPVGNYAVRLVFDDLHDTGIFSWAYLRHLGENRMAIWSVYLDALSAGGLSREPPQRG